MELLRPETTLPVFANGSAADELKIFGTDTESTDLTLLLTNAKAIEGWAGGVDANGFPALGWFNAIGHTLSYVASLYLQDGITKWSSLQEYYIGSRTIGSDGNAYKAVTGTNGNPNLGNDPVGDATNWQSVSGITSVNIIETLLDVVVFANGDSINVKGYHTVNGGGGGVFNYVSSIDKSTAEAITIFDPSVSLALQGTGIGTGCWVRQYEGKVNAKMGGIIGDETTDDYSALLNLKTHFPSFELTDVQCRIGTNITFDISPIFSNASLVVDNLITVTFNIVPNATREHIFKGDGDVKLNNSTSHFAYPEWYGAFPEITGLDNGVPLQKLSDSIKAGSECRIEFGDGTWYIQTGVVWSRACSIQGSGDRITHFRATGALATVGDVFSTADEGVHFRDIQFSSASIRTSGRYIALLHNYCKALDIWFTDGFQGIESTGALCEIKGVQGFAWSTATSSFLCKITGSTSKMSNITFIGTTNAPKYVALVGDSSDVIVNNIRGSGANIEGVLGLIVSSGSIDNLTGSKIYGTSTIRAVHILTTESGNIDGVNIDNIIPKSCTGDGVRLDKQGSGIFKYINLSDVKASGCVSGVRTFASSGTIQHFSLVDSMCRGSALDGVLIEDTQYFTLNNVHTISNTRYGISIDANSDNFILTSNQSLFNATALADNSGAVTKVIKNNIGIADV